MDNIVAAADRAAEIYGIETVRKVFRKYGADFVEELRPSQYEDIFGELHQMAADY